MEIRTDVFLREQVQTYRQARLGMVLGSRQSGRTIVRLGELTRLLIERDVVQQGGVLRLERGAMLFDRPRSRRDVHPKVWTPVASIVARGTRFFVGPSGGVIGVFVERGIVDVVNRAGRVTLVAGEGTNLKSQDIPPTAPVRWGAARIGTAMASVL
jgi:ferric-dicitrate binding protein FerR (iron transport regulator)